MNNNSPDCLVIGAGIFGLWAARHAIKRGERVLVLDKAHAGAGASGGFLGALMPHMPDRWNAKKQMQYEALSSLPDAIGLLEEDTGLDCGYRQCGRLMPMAHEKLAKHVEERSKGAELNWQGEFSLEATRADQFLLPNGEAWLTPDIAKFGATYDTLSARVNPRAYITALAKYARDYAELRERTDVTSIDVEACSVQLADGDTINAGRIVVANGYQAYSLLSTVDARFKRQPITGRGVKGQAVLLDYEHNDELPIIYDDGSYIVPHAGNSVAIGSTSLKVWDVATSFDENDMHFYEHAMALAPQLRDAPIIERWASVRPRNTVPDPNTGKIGTEPIFGPLEGVDRISVAIGGFKISLGIGHVVTAEE